LQKRFPAPDYGRAACLSSGSVDTRGRWRSH